MEQTLSNAMINTKYKGSRRYEKGAKVRYKINDSLAEKVAILRGVLRYKVDCAIIPSFFLLLSPLFFPLLSFSPLQCQCFF